MKTAAPLNASQLEAVAAADAHLNNAAMPTYSDMARGLDELCAWLEKTTMSSYGRAKVANARALAAKVLP